MYDIKEEEQQKCTPINSHYAKNLSHDALRLPISFWCQTLILHSMENKKFNVKHQAGLTPEVWRVLSNVVDQ